MKEELKRLKFLVARNNKIYFKDKMQFFMSLLTPIILIVLFLTFLGNVYKNSLKMCLPEGVTLNDGLINAFTGSWLFSSILAVSCITIAICSNVSVMDKINKSNLDYLTSPVKRTTLQLGYIISNFVTAFIVCMTAFIIGIIYFLIVGWYFSFVDILLILVNIILVVLMGSLIASIISFFLSSQSALGAVCSLVSSMYGFLCGAYMPISQFSTTIQNFVGFIPGTYSTIIFRNYYMRGVLAEIGKSVPESSVNYIRQNFDAGYKFFGTDVPIWAMFLITITFIAVLFVAYVLIIIHRNKTKK